MGIIDSIAIILIKKYLSEKKNCFLHAELLGLILGFFIVIIFLGFFIVIIIILFYFFFIIILFIIIIIYSLSRGTAVGVLLANIACRQFTHARTHARVCERYPHEVRLPNRTEEDHSS